MSNFEKTATIASGNGKAFDLHPGSLMLRRSQRRSTSPEGQLWRNPKTSLSEQINSTSVATTLKPQRSRQRSVGLLFFSPQSPHYLNAWDLGRISDGHDEDQPL
jgi:hypothetical protein